MEEQIEISVDQGVTLLTTLTEKAVELGLVYGPKLLLAIIVLFVGMSVIKGMLKVMDAALTRAKVEPTLSSFLHSITSVVLKTVLIIIFASMIGVETASLIAMLGAAGLAIGLALQGSLANFAGGVLILLFKPFKAGDVIEAQGYVGRVREIQIFNTILTTMDNQKVVIPNGMLSNGCVKNLFSESTRRVDLTFGISYKDDILKAKGILDGLAKEDERVLKSPGHEIYVSAHAESSVNILMRVWVNSDNYWPVHFAMIEKVKIAFDKENVTIPFPQRDVHIHQAS
jgi:small conductance mechanosensitive channel